jgi:hypothetical protein
MMAMKLLDAGYLILVACDSWLGTLVRDSWLVVRGSSFPVSVLWLPTSGYCVLFYADFIMSHSFLADVMNASFFMRNVVM